jgi:hypothetical protein
VAVGAADSAGAAVAWVGSAGGGVESPHPTAKAAAKMTISPYDKRLFSMRKLSWGDCGPRWLADFSSDVEIVTIASLV